MAVTAVVTRNHATSDQSTFIEYCTAALTGTYATNGFTFNPFTVVGGKGSSPLPSSSVLVVDWYSPSGYNYRSSIAGNVVTTKIYSVAGTELANTTAVPDASVPVTIVKRKI
jgi:hypothetical protein